MANLHVSVVSSLKLVPVDGLTRFSMAYNRVVMTSLRRPVEAGAVPGSARIASDLSDGIHQKSITYRVAPVTPEAADKLDALCASRLVAIYTDENGNIRVAGSPDYPLTLTYTSAEGAFMCTATGQGTAIDPFLI